MSDLQVDRYGIEQTPDSLYDYSDEVTEGVNGFDSITDAHVDQFRELGFLVVHNAIHLDAIQSAKDALRDLILNPAFKNVWAESAVASELETMSDEEKVLSVRKLIHFVDHDTRLKRMAEAPDLLAVMKRLIDQTPALMQDMALIKPPRVGREKPWHQDMAYFNLPTETRIVGVWIALDEAIPENGCMMVIPGTQKEGPVLHWDRRDWQICDTDVQVGRSLAIPLPPGGCLLFDALLHHGTPPSHSDKPRWALQYHYKPASVQAFENSDYRLAIFGEEGKDATC